MTLSTILGLLFRRGPLAVIRAIVTIVVDTVKLMLYRGSPSHVCVEVLKPLPSFINLNPTTAIIFVRDIFSIRTPLPHTAPRFMFRGAIGNASMAVTNTSLLGKFILKTAAGFYVFFPKMVIPRNGKIATLTATNAQILSFCFYSYREYTDYRQTVERLPY